MGHETTENHVDQHELKSELIKKLRPLYEGSHGPLIQRIFGFLQDPFHGHYHVHIHTENYKHPDENEISESQQVGRTVYALKKIKELNHHFFPFQEQQILNPLAPGFIPLAMKISFAGFDALLLNYLWRNWSFNIRSVAFFAGCFGFQQVAMHFPNLGNEIIQSYRRKQMAKQYIEAYGYGFFHKILDPRFDVNEIAHLHNKLY